jgi:hypothetical protein
MVPPPPPELQGQPLKIDYISLLAQAQKMMGLQGMRSYVDMARMAYEVNPESIVKTNFDFLLDEYAQGLSLPPQITVPDDQVALIRQQQQKMQQMAQEIEMLKQGSEAVRNIGSVSE